MSVSTITTNDKFSSFSVSLSHSGDSPDLIAADLVRHVAGTCPWYRIDKKDRFHGFRHRRYYYDNHVYHNPTSFRLEVNQSFSK
ncbi:MAG: hypothetical protein ACYSU0_07190 [Planctomycetota bacterium]